MPTDHRVSTPSIKLNRPVKYLEGCGQEPCGVGLQAPLIQDVKKVPVIAKQLARLNKGEFVHWHNSEEKVVEEGLVFCDNEAAHSSEVCAAILCQK